MQFLRDAPRRLGRPDEPVDVGLVESSYLYLASAQGRATLEQRVSLQQAAGVPAVLRDRAALSARYPWLNLSDLAAGCDTAGGEGWFDGHSLLSALRRDNERSGIGYLKDRAVEFERDADGAIAAVRLENYGRVACRYAVVAAGTGSRQICAAAGIDLPVFARKRTVFVFSCPVPIPNCPLVIDPSGLWFRPEHDRFLCGPPADPDPNVALDDFEPDLSLFEAVAWPTLAHRVPAFEAIRMNSAWAGHYDYNDFDQNAFVGPVSRVPNLLLASGFSGHGLQQAPAIGRGLAEHICYGNYRSIDLAPLSYSRFVAASPLRELNVI